MFLDNLSVSVHRACDTRKLSYEIAAELCSLSSRYFGDIPREKTASTILTLEKRCVGFDLMLIPSTGRQASFRKPMPELEGLCQDDRHLPGGVIQKA